MEEKKVRISPIGVAVYPHLSQPNRKFNQDGIYCVDLQLEPNEENKKFLGGLYQETKKEFESGYHLPYKKQVSKETEQETGSYLVTFKSSYAPKIYDIYGKIIDENIIVGSGSVAQIAFIPNIYQVSGANKGMNLYLQAVLIKDLKEYKHKDAIDYGFDVQQAPEPDEILSEDINIEQGPSEELPPEML